MRTFLILISLLLVATQSTSAHAMDGKNDYFAFYALKGEIALERLNDIKPESVSLDGRPLFTAANVISYSEVDSSIQLTQNAFAKFMKLRAGTPFAICVKNRPVYLGVVWKQISAVSCDAIVATAVYPLDRHQIKISAGYPTPAYYRGKHPNVASHLFDLLRAK